MSVVKVIKSYATVIQVRDLVCTRFKLPFFQWWLFKIRIMTVEIHLFDLLKLSIFAFDKEFSFLKFLRLWYFLFIYFLFAITAIMEMSYDWKWDIYPPTPYEVGISYYTKPYGLQQSEKPLPYSKKPWHEINETIQFEKLMA